MQRNYFKNVMTLAIVAVASLAMTAQANAALVKIDLSANSGSASGYDVFSADGGPTSVTDWSGGGDNDVTLSITGILGNNNPAAAGATTVDGITVPLEANNDYVWGDSPANSGSILFEFKNLDAGSYNASVFAGRTNDSNQEGTIWVGALGDEPGKNTGDFANSSATLLVSVGASDSLFYPHSPGTDWVGGTSGIILNPIAESGQVPEPTTVALLGVGGLMMLKRRRRQSAM